MNVDPILALESLGYTEREAAFLYLVAVHSGHFLRRQFDYFTDRNKGALVMRFLEKARVAGHIEFLDYQQGWHVYHLFSRVIYRLLGDAESQHRAERAMRKSAPALWRSTMCSKTTATITWNPKRKRSASSRKIAE